MVSRVFGLPKRKVTVRNLFGGAFGSGLRPQYQLLLAVMAALKLRRSVRVVLTRQQMFTFGHRPETWQRVRLAARQDGTLASIVHEAVAETSRLEDYVEVVVNWSAQLYACENLRDSYKLVDLDQYSWTCARPARRTVFMRSRWRWTNCPTRRVGLPLEQVTFHLGDSDLPLAPIEGGSAHVATIGSAVDGVCEKLQHLLWHMARRVKGSGLETARFEVLEFTEGEIRLRSAPDRAMSLAALMAASPPISSCRTSPGRRRRSARCTPQYSGICPTADGPLRHHEGAACRALA